MTAEDIIATLAAKQIAADKRVIYDEDGNPDIQANALRVGRIDIRYQEWLELHKKAVKHERACSTGTIHVDATEGEPVPPQSAKCFRVDHKISEKEGEIFIVSCRQAPPFPPVL